MTDDRTQDGSPLGARYASTDEPARADATSDGAPSQEPDVAEREYKKIQVSTAPPKKKERNLKPVIWVLAAVCAVLIAITFILPRLQPETKKSETTTPAVVFPSPVKTAEEFRTPTEKELKGVFANPAAHIGRGYLLYGIVTTAKDGHAQVRVGAKAPVNLDDQRKAAGEFPYLTWATLPDGSELAAGDMFYAKVTTGTPLTSNGRSYPFLQISEASPFPPTAGINPSK